MKNSPANNSLVVVALRTVAVLLALPLTALTVYFAPDILLHGKLQFIPIGFDLGFATAAALLWWLALRGGSSRSRRIVLSALLGAASLGLVGFAVGYHCYGISWAILAAGPLSFVFGALLGGSVAVVRTRRVDHFNSASQS